MKDHRLAVAELGGVLDLDRDACQLLNEILATQPSVPRGAAGDDEDARRADEALHVGHETAEVDVALLEVEPAAHAVLQDLGLLADLFEHEVLELALLNLVEAELELLHLARTATHTAVRSHAISRALCAARARLVRTSRMSLTLSSVLIS